MKQLKYIRFEMKGPVLFGAAFKHTDFNHVSPCDKILSAAFAAIGEDGSVGTYGESVSMGKKNIKGDARMIWKLLQEIGSEMQMSCRDIPANSWEDHL